jgi:hypothetical protein
MSSSSGSGEYGKVRVRYNGPIGNHRVVGLATRTKYGRHKRGDVFWVQREDVEANPDVFIVLGDDLSIAARLPKTPDDLRLDAVAPVVAEPSVTSQQIEAALSGVPAGLIDEDLPFESDTDGTPIAALGLNGRVVGTLLGAGIETVEALREAYDSAGLVDISGIGEKTLDEIQAKLEEFDAAE